MQATNELLEFEAMGEENATTPRSADEAPMLVERRNKASTGRDNSPRSGRLFEAMWAKDTTTPGQRNGRSENNLTRSDDAKELLARVKDLVQTSMWGQLVTVAMTAGMLLAMYMWLTGAPIKDETAIEPQCPKALCGQLWAALQRSELTVEDLTIWMPNDDGTRCACEQGGTPDGPMNPTTPYADDRIRAMRNRGTDDARKQRARMGKAGSNHFDSTKAPRMCWLQMSMEGKPTLECNRAPWYKANPNVCVGAVRSELYICTDIPWIGRDGDAEKVRWYSEIEESDISVDETTSAQDAWATTWWLRGGRASGAPRPRKIGTTPPLHYEPSRRPGEKQEPAKDQSRGP